MPKNDIINELVLKEGYMNYKASRSHKTYANWSVIIKIVSCGLIALSLIFVLYDAIGLYLHLNSDEDRIQPYLADKETLSFLGMSDTTMKILSLITDVLIFIQGLYGIICVNQNTKSSIGRLIKLTLVLSGLHIVLIITKLVVASSFARDVEKNQNGKFHEDDIDRIKAFVYSIIIATFIFSMIVTCF